MLHSAPPFVVYDGETFPGPSYQHDSSAIVVLTFEGSGGPVDVFFPINNFLVGRNKFTRKGPKERSGLFNAAPPNFKGRNILGLVRGRAILSITDHTYLVTELLPNSIRRSSQRGKQ